MALGNNPTQLDVVKEVKRLDADKANSSSLATVATTGSYNDLTDQPTQPTVDQTYNSASTNAQSGTAVAGALSPVVAIAEGKTKSYVIQSQSNITGTKDANDEYTGVSAITDVTIADLKLGDLILIKDLNVPDYWVSQLNKTGDVVTSVSLSKMETTKVDLTDYVTTNTAQTIIGAKTFQGTLYSKSASIDLSNPNGAKYLMHDFLDKEGRRIGIFGAIQSGNGRFTMYTQVGNRGSINLSASSSGTWNDEDVKFEIPNPANDANDNRAATTKWAKDNLVDITSAQTISGAKTLSTDLTFNASGQTQLIWKTSDATTGFIRSGISGSDKYIVTQADKHYWGSIANTNRIIFDPADKSLRSETNENISLGTSGYRWRNIYGTTVSTQYYSNISTGRPSSLNFSHYYDTTSVTKGKVHCRLDVAAGTQTGKPKADGYVLTCFWDNSGKYDAQFYIPNSKNNPQVRYADNANFNSQTWYSIPLMDWPSQTGSFYATNIYASSDRRLKENIKDAELDCGAVIDKLPIKEFNFKSDEEKKVVVGAIAQELMEILPEKYRATLVSGSEDTSYSINEGKLLYVAIGALKDEMKKTKELEARLERIEKLLEK